MLRRGATVYAVDGVSFSRNHDSLSRLINRETFLGQMDRALRHARQKDSQHASYNFV